MQENNFEKQVQQKTDELRLKPSDEVWQKVSAAIAKTKKDRRVFAAVLLLLLFIGSAIFIIWDRTSGGEINNAVSTTKSPGKNSPAGKGVIENDARQITAIPGNQETSNKNATGDKLTTDDIPAAQKTANLQKNTPSHLRVKIIAPIVSNKQAEEDNNIIDQGNIAKGKPNKKSQNSKYKTREKIAVIVNSAAPELANDDTRSNDQDKSKTAVVAPETIDLAITQPSTDVAVLNKNDEKDQVKNPADHKETANVKSLNPTKQKSKWRIGATVSVGVAAMQDGYFGIIGPGGGDELKLYDANPAQSNNGGSTGQGNAAYPPYTPSKIKNGTGFVTGVFVQKDISSGINFLVGLNYKTYSSTMTTGNRVDSFFNLNYASYYYRNGNTQEYKNHFHFVELPVAFRFKLGKQNKVPIYLNTGLSLSRLISSNALQFDTASRAYYTSNGQLNKTLVNVSAGLLFSLSGQAKNAFLIGPDINYSLNKMAGSGLYQNRHYSYFGIVLQKSFGKK